MGYLVAVALLIMTVAPAQAYIDPGTGTYVLQLAMAGVLGVAFSIKLGWQRLKASAGRIFAGASRPQPRSGA